MNNIYTQNQSKDKITSIPGRIWLSSLTCYNNDNDESEVINLTSLESMWYNHEETINHPEGEDYPTEVNMPFKKLMNKRVAKSVLARTGIDVLKFDNIIHASSLPAITN